MRICRLTPDNELRLHLVKAQEFWREDRLDVANEAMRNALRVGLPPGNWYDFQRMLEAELAARQTSEFVVMTASLTIETDPDLWGDYWPTLRTVIQEAVDKVAETMQITWDRPVHVTLFAEESWLDFMHARYGYYAKRIESHKVCLPPSAVLHPATLRRAILHESAHAAVHQLAGEEVPRWLDEGIAVWMEGNSQAGIPLPPLTLDDISAGFERFDVELGSPRSHISYAAAGDFVRSQIEEHGLRPLLDFLARLGSGERIERAWRAVFGEKVRDAERKWNETIEQPG